MTLQALRIESSVTLNTISDEALMLEFQGGSRTAFEQLFARYRGPLYGFFRRRLWSHGDERADDLTQETFLAVIRASARYEPRALVRTYLYGIAINLVSAERRHRFRDQPPGQPAPEAITGNAPDASHRQPGSLPAGKYPEPAVLAGVTVSSSATGVEEAAAEFCSVIVA